MSKIAFIYPGQGAQKAGMGADFYENSEIARYIFDQAGEELDLDMKELCFEENDRLDLTEYTQAAMVTTCLAMTRAVESMGLHADMTAGLSLGEYCAIAVAGGMCDLDAIRTVRSRGIFMEHAAPEGSGAMSAVLGMDAAVIENVLNGREGVSIANYNCPGQIVITGEAAAVAEAGTALKEAGARRAMPLAVSGPFHSSLMKEAGEKLKEEAEKYNFTMTDIKLVANTTANILTSVDEVKDEIYRQSFGPVKWVDTIKKLKSEGVTTIYEIGPGKVLAGLIKKIDKEIEVKNIEKLEDLSNI